MGKLNFHTLSFVNDLKTGEVGKRIVHVNKSSFKTIEKIKEIKTMANTYVRHNTKQPDGSGVPDMPVMNFGEKKEPDPIELVLNHFERKFDGNSTKARAELKKLSGDQVLKLLDALKHDESETSIAFKKGDFEVYSMPKI